MTLILVAIESIVIFIGFFYLIHLVSHLRNSRQMQAYFDLIDRMNGEVLLSDTLFKNMRVLGVITKAQQQALTDRMESKEDDEQES